MSDANYALHPDIYPYPGAVTQDFGAGDSSVTLGDITFSQTEVPPQITWSGIQRLVRHVAPGGVIVVDALGIDYPPIEWEGIFEGSDASDRAQHLHALMQMGQEVTLSWLDQSYQVVVKQASFDHRTVGWIPYHVRCEVISRADAGPPPDIPSLDESVNDDASAAVDTGIEGDDLDSVEAIQTAAAVPNAFDPRGAAFVSLTQSVDDSQAQLLASQANAEASLAKLQAEASLDNTLFPADPLNAAANVTLAVTQAANLAQLVTAAAYIGRINTNLSQVGP
jgi:hypothetical protein